MLPFGLGTTELVVILVLALLVFGPKRLPDVGRTIGRATREFKNSVGEIDELRSSVKESLTLDPDENAKPGSGKRATRPKADRTEKAPRA